MAFSSGPFGWSCCGSFVSDMVPGPDPLVTVNGTYAYINPRWSRGVFDGRGTGITAYGPFGTGVPAAAGSGRDLFDPEQHGTEREQEQDPERDRSTREAAHEEGRRDT